MQVVVNLMQLRQKPVQNLTTSNLTASNLTASNRFALDTGSSTSKSVHQQQNQSKHRAL
jgi:hypothetical protein